MKQDDRKQGTSRGNTPDRERKTQPDARDEKASVGGDYNSGVTSEDAAEKEQIEKQASLGKNQPKSHKENEQGGLTKEELPDATNESKGQMGSGTRQDSN